jgi:hypothetical protein
VFVEKINKIDKPLAKLTERNRRPKLIERWKRGYYNRYP